MRPHNLSSLRERVNGSNSRKSSSVAIFARSQTREHRAINLYMRISLARALTHARAQKERNDAARQDK